MKKKTKKVKPTPRLKFPRKTGTMVHEVKKKKSWRKRKHRKAELPAED